MNEPKRFGMQRLARNNFKAVIYKLFVFREHRALQYFIASVSSIVEQRVAYEFHVRPYLVRATCLEFAFQQ